MTTTDTPRTDAEIFEIQDCNGQLRKVITIQYAKQLERQLAVSLENQVKTQAEAERLRDAIAAELKELRDEIEKLQFLIDKLRQRNRELYADKQVLVESLGS